MKKIFHASLNTQDNVQLFNVPGVTHAKTTKLPNPRSALDTIVDKEKLFVFYNHSFKNRSRLSVACTDKLDGTFSWMYDIENAEDNKDTEWAYPYVIKDEAFVYMIYSKNKSELHSRKFPLKNFIRLVWYVHPFAKHCIVFIELVLTTLSKLLFSGL